MDEDWRQREKGSMYSYMREREMFGGSTVEKWDYIYIYIGAKTII